MLANLRKIGPRKKRFFSKRLLAVLVVCAVVLTGSGMDILPVQAATNGSSSIWDDFAESMQDSSLSDNLNTAWEWLKDRFTDGKGIVDGIIYSTSRKGYRSNDRPTEPTLNAVIDGKWGDERSFVKICDIANDKNKSTSIKLQKGHTYKVTIFCVNDCKKDLDIEGLEMYVDLPAKVNKKSPQELKVALASSNTTPELIFDGVKLKASGKVRVKYVAKSMKISCRGKAKGSLLSDDVFNIDKRAKLGYDDLDGTLPAGDKKSLKISFRIKVS